MENTFFGKVYFKMTLADARLKIPNRLMKDFLINMDGSRICSSRIQLKSEVFILILKLEELLWKETLLNFGWKQTEQRL